MPVEEVGRLLHRWRETGGVVSRGRLVAEGMRLLRGLDPDERRVLARALTEDGVPDLAAQIEGRTGRPIAPDDLERLTDGLLDLDAAQVDHLVAALGDPDQRRRLARDAIGAAAAQHLPPPGPAADAGTGPPPPPGNPFAGVAGLHALARNEVPADSPDLGDQALDHPGLAEVKVADVGLTEVSVATAGVHDVALHDPHGGHRTGDGAVPVSAAQTDHGEQEARPGGHAGASDEGDDHLQTTGDHLHDPDASVPPDDHLDDPAQGGEPAARGVAVVATGGDMTAAGLVAQLGRTDSAVARFAILSPAALARVDAAGALEVLDAVPEGWQRRRAAQRLLAAGALEGVDLGRLLGRFPRPRDVTFLAGALVDAGHTSAEGLGDLVPPLVRLRLAARQGS